MIIIEKRIVINHIFDAQTLPKMDDHDSLYLNNQTGAVRLHNPGERLRNPYPDRSATSIVMGGR